MTTSNLEASASSVISQGESSAPLVTGQKFSSISPTTGAELPSTPPLTDEVKSSASVTTDRETFEQLTTNMEKLSVSLPKYKETLQGQSASPIAPPTAEEERLSVPAPIVQGAYSQPLSIDQETDSVPRPRDQSISSVAPPTTAEQEKLSGVPQTTKQKRASTAPQRTEQENPTTFATAEEEKQSTTPPTAEQKKPSRTPTAEQGKPSTATNLEENRPPMTQPLLGQEKPILIKIADIPGKGKGLVACAPIKRGQVIFSEQPLIVLEEIPSKESENQAIAKIHKMNRDDQRKVLALSNNFPEYSPILGVLATNATLIDIPGSTTYYVFALASRINHSCSSNAFCTWNGPNREYEVYAGRDIEEGEEVVKGSITTNQWTQPRDKRRECIVEYFRFHCLCKTCTMPEEEVTASNERRMKYGEFNDALPALIQQGQGSKVVLYCREMLKILEQEKEGSLKVPMTYRTLGLISISNGDMGRAKAFMRLCAESHVGIPGVNLQRDVDECWAVEKKNAEKVFGVGRKWKSSEKTTRWKDDEGFEEWLWAHAY